MNAPGRDVGEQGNGALEHALLEQLRARAEELHEQALQELRAARAEARRIRNDALDAADDLWLRTWRLAEAEAAAVVEAARDVAPPVIGNVVELPRRDAPPELTVVPDARGAERPVVLSALVLAALSGLLVHLVPVAGVVAATATLALLVHLGAGTATAGLTVVPVALLARAGTSTTLVGDHWWPLAVAAPVVGAAALLLRDAGVRPSRRAWLVVTSLGAAAGVAGAGLDPVTTATSAAAGAAVLGPGLTCAVLGLRVPGVGRALATGAGAVLAVAMTGAASPVDAVITAATGAAASTVLYRSS